MQKTIYKLISMSLTGLIIMSCADSEIPQIEERVIAVKAATISYVDKDFTQTFTGSLKGEQQAVLYSKISESVEKVFVKEGEEVKQGQVLIELDKYGPSSQFQQTQSLYLNSEKNYKKYKHLFKEGAVSESQFDAAKTEYNINKASFEAAKQLVEIQSPINGIVTSLNISKGDFLNPGTEIATIATTEKLRVELDVNLNTIKYFNIGDKVTVEVKSIGQTLVGEIISIAQSTDPKTRSVQVEVLIDNSENLLQPGSFVIVNVLLDRVESAIIIPRSVIIELNNQATVFTVVNGLAQKKEIELGLELDGSVIVESGLMVGDTLITLGQDYLEDGVNVNIVNDLSVR